MDQGLNEKALWVMADELRLDPEDEDLQRDFYELCKSMGRDPKSVLVSAALKGEAAAGAQRADSFDLRDGRLEGARPPGLSGDESGERTGDTTDSQEMPGANRLQVLRSYLEKIKTGKEKKP
jgi:hypothetical protein